MSCEVLIHLEFYVKVQSFINVQVSILDVQKMKKMCSFLARCVLGIQEKSSENFSNRQRSPEKQKPYNSLELEAPRTLNYQN